MRIARLAAAAGTIGALLAGITGGAQPAQAATSVPSWLIPMYFSHDVGNGTHRACTGIALSRTRTLATPDCFTGRGDSDTAWDYTLRTGMLEGGFGGPRYESHPQYATTTRRADLSVFLDQNPASYGKPVLASSADTALYKAGAKAVFYSWAGIDANDAPRVKHSEQTVVKSAADCAALLGTSLPAGTLCTAPAPGSAPVADDDQCFGDAGGALVAGGKLIGVSATRSTGCVAGGVRLYSKVSSYRSLITGWTRDVDLEYRDSGSVIAREPRDLADVCGTDQAGKLMGCAVDGSGSLMLNGLNFVTQAGDLNGDGYGDLIARTTAGTLYRVPGDEFFNTDPQHRRTKIGTGWQKYTRIVAARDVSGDGLPDILAQDGSGTLWLYRTTSAGKLTARTKISTGWQKYTALAGRGDLSGDGRPDLLARDRSGVLWLLRGNGKGGFATRTRIGGGWGQYNAIVASGDMDHNGHQDILTRTPAGAVYLYNANDKGGFSARKQLAKTAWKKYARIS